MSLSDMRNEIGAAGRVLSNADEVAASMADLLQGRLQHCRPWVLAQLKRELKDFNIHTKRWKNE